MLVKIPKWTIASFAKHFESLCSTSNFPMYVEGTGRKANRSPDYFEFRINGPYVRQLTQNEYKIWVIINLLIVNTFDEKQHYTQNINQGILLAAFTPTVGLYKYGTDIDDDSTLVDCFSLSPDNGEEIKITNFGQLGDHIRVMQSTIEACYQLYYTP